MELNSLNDVLTDQLADLYSAEKQLVDALPKMAAAAHDSKLREAFDEHLEETRGHMRRLEEIFSELGMPKPSKQCEAMAGLIEEGEEVLGASGQPEAIDAALIAAAQRVEHYEIAAYGTARTLAGELDYDSAESMLDETLSEEANADKLLTKIATGGMMRSGINREAT
jgi:ferritin-like metal-binding protein YciE